MYTSWNVALEASDMHHFETTTVLMIACATLLECHPSPSTKQLCTRKVAFLMAATAALEVSGRAARCCWCWCWYSLRF